MTAATSPFLPVYCALTLWISCGNLAYELFYAFTTTSTTFELGCFLAWFGLDFTFAVVVIKSAYAPEKRGLVTTRLVAGFVACLAFLYVLTTAFPDENQQLTAYWTGILLQLPIGYVSVYHLLKHGDTRGHSLETW